MNQLEFLRLRALRQAGELSSTLRDLETEAGERGTTRTSQRAGVLYYRAESILDDLRETLRERVTA